MSDELPERAVRWVIRAIGAGSRIDTIQRLPLGGWHTNHLIAIVDGHRRVHRLVLRRWARPDWQVDDPDYTAAREAGVLALLAATPVPAPQVIDADLDGTDCDVPALLLTCLPGHPPTRTTMRHHRFYQDLAGTLAQIHATGAAGLGQLQPYRLYYDRLHAAPPRWLPNLSVWDQATRIVQATPPEPVSTLIHRDFHPENTLWSQSRLTGVVDWTQTSWGPAALDLGHMRWNLVLDDGLELADRFLTCYQTVTGHSTTDQPYWDLVSLFDLLLDRDPTNPGDLDTQDQQRLSRYVETLITRLE